MNYGDFNADWNDAQADEWLEKQYMMRNLYIEGRFIFKLLSLFLPKEVVYGILL